MDWLWDWESKEFVQSVSNINYDEDYKMLSKKPNDTLVLDYAQEQLVYPHL